MKRERSRLIDERLEEILIEVQRLSRGFAQAVRQIVEQEAEINSLHLIVAQKGLVTPEELDAARGEALAKLNDTLQSVEDAGGKDIRTLPTCGRWKM